jgi:hypothetical protein
MEPSLLKKSIKKNDEKKKKTKRWKQKLYVSDFGRPSDRLYWTFRNPEGTVRNSGRQVRELKIHYAKLSWTLHVLEDGPIATQAQFIIIHKIKRAPSWAGKYPAHRILDEVCIASEWHQKCFDTCR